MTFAVTPLYALALAVIVLVLWFRTTAMLLRIRHHGTFVEWTCLVLILMNLAQGMGAPTL